MDAPVIALPQGKIRGLRTDSVSAFLGIPYAAAPVGPALFQAPGPAPTWDDERDATRFGPTAPQLGYGPPTEDILENPIIEGGEFLNLNVWTPDPGGSGLPVLVWIHGGAYRFGSSAVSMYDGRAFARDGVVLVSINYRLGAIGYALLDDAPANRGLLDQLAALRWVRDNIAAFGGDPDRVTVAGESAGSMSVADLFAAPGAAGLFQRAIMQSSDGKVASLPEDARRVAADLAERLGIATTTAEFGAVEVPTLLKTERAQVGEFAISQTAARWGASVIAAGKGIMPFTPVIDGASLVSSPLDAIAAGAAREIPLLVGANADESRLFTAPPGLTATLPAETLAGYAAVVGLSPDDVAVYTANRPDATPGDIFSAIMSDQTFRVPTTRMAQAATAAGGTAHVYEFAWQTTHLGLRACHALEIPFVFDTLSSPGMPMMTGTDVPPQQVADDMHRTWVEFAKGNAPDWPAYDAQARTVMVFQSPRSAAGPLPRADEFDRWENVL
ncbi:carboxylesterase/lipase family protein [Nocardia sp. NPDC052566]|uniref:carboxylesterase/lipase family protein n=1 Tax=Nocardia sp. NPDC052566 TaxID=3364330 RepID=UPI0037CA6241